MQTDTHEASKGKRWKNLTLFSCAHTHKEVRKNISHPSITQNRNCHQSLETISQLNGQIAKIPILDLAQFYLLSLTTVVDMVQNSFGNHDQVFHGFITLRVTQLSFSFSC